MASTVGREVPKYFSQKTGMGHLEQQTNRVRHGWGRGGEPLRTHIHGTPVGYKKYKFERMANRVNRGDCEKQGGKLRRLFSQLRPRIQPLY
jgi:hypothetical protein